MKEFRYVIKDAVGIHARPAGELVKKAKGYASTISIEKSGKVSDLTRLMAVMGMAVKHGDEVIVRAEGSDEESALEGIKLFFEKNL